MLPWYHVYFEVTWLLQQAKVVWIFKIVVTSILLNQILKISKNKAYAWRKVVEWNLSPAKRVVFSVEKIPKRANKSTVKVLDNSYCPVSRWKPHTWKLIFSNFFVLQSSKSYILFKDLNASTQCLLQKPQWCHGPSMTKPVTVHPKTRVWMDALA